MKFPLWGRKQRDENLNEEIQAHLTLAEREEMESGQSKKNAQDAAHQEFGNVTLTEEVTRDMWGWRWLSDLWQDVRYGLRMLRMNPGFTTVAVLTLALGIGANTAIFSLIDAVMLRMLPVEKPQELMLVARNSSSKNLTIDQYFTNPIWEQIRDHQNAFSGVFAWFPTSIDLAKGGESHNANMLYVSGDFFDTLGLHPAAGRLLTNGDDVRGCPATAVVSYGFWQRHFGGAPSAIGSILSLDRQPFQIIGVTAPGFFGLDVGQKFDVAVPLCTEAIIDGKGQMLDGRMALWLNIMGRPKAGISPEKVRANLQVIWPDALAAAAPPNWFPFMEKSFVGSTLTANLAPTGISSVRKTYDQPLRILMIIVSLVLLVACANIGSLMLARATVRHKEIAVRMALGASRFRLIRQLLTECILLSCMGAILGILFARWGCMLLVGFISTPANPLFVQFSLDGRILAFTATVAVATGLLFGLLPALGSTRVSLTAAIKGSHSIESGNRPHFYQARWIVASQVALSLVLVIVATLFLRSFHKLLTLDAGFDRNHVLVISADESNGQIPPIQRTYLNRQILEKLVSLPGVISASESFLTPLTGGKFRDTFRIDSDKGPKGEDAQAAPDYISPGYFPTLQIPILEGRNFTEQDRIDELHVAIINQTMARKFFPHSDPIGEYIHLGKVTGTENSPPVQVIGVTKDAKYGSLRQTTPSAIYFPLAQTEAPSLEFMIRTASSPSSLTRSVEEAITGVNKDISLRFETLEEQVDSTLGTDRLLATLSGFFGGLALLLAMIGLYGVLAYMVTQRRKEIGIRLALGAGRGSILRLVLRDVSILLAVGISLGVLVSLWATQFLQKMLFELKARDAKTIIFSAALLAIVALFAGYLPARRASRLNPMVILREE